MRLQRHSVASMLALSLVLTAGCSPSAQRPTAPAEEALAPSLAQIFENLVPGRGRDWSAYFPLDSGSVWTYVREYRTNLLPTDGVGEMETFRSRITARMLGTRVMEGQLYSLLSETESSDLGDYPWETFLRQDATGLYQYQYSRRPAPPSTSLRKRAEALGANPAARAAWDRAIDEIEARRARFHAPAASGAGGLPEYRRLAYPLVPGSQWTASGYPGTQVIAEGTEVFRTGQGAVPAWRLRSILVGLSSPEDVTHDWYGRAGYLGHHSRYTILAADEFGNIYGFAEVEDWERLESFELAGGMRRGGHRGDPGSGIPGIGPAAISD